MTGKAILSVFALVVLAFGLIVEPRVGSAAQIGCALREVETGKCAFGSLRGAIAPGDYDKVKKLVDDAWPNLFLFSLESAGGSVYDAIKIGRLFRKYLIAADVPSSYCYSDEPKNRPANAPPFDPTKPYTVLPTAPHGSCVCASACALIWFGAVERMGTVGLHRPRIDDPDFANSPPEEATKRYRRALSEMEAYLTDMEVPRPVLDAMLATSSGEIRWIDVNDSLARPPSYAEWEDASCHNQLDGQGPFFDACRRNLRLGQMKKLSAP
jgi:hypothetical protein